MALYDLTQGWFPKTVLALTLCKIGQQNIGNGNFSDFQSFRGAPGVVLL